MQQAENPASRAETALLTCLSPFQRSALPLHRREKLQDGRVDVGRSVHFQVAGASPPGLVAAELVLLRRRQVAVVAVGQLDGEGWPQRAFLLDRQPNLNEHLTGNGRDS